MGDKIETTVNEVLLQNGWDYDDRKRVLFMLRNHKPRERTLDEAVDAVYRRYGTNLTAFFADARMQSITLWPEKIINALRPRLSGEVVVFLRK